MTTPAAAWWYTGTRGRIEVEPMPRPPIVAWPTCASCPSPYAYYNALPWPNSQPPQERDYLRMDAWGVEIPGLPVVPGASSEPNSSRNRVLTYFLDRWPKDWQRRILETHAGYGYTHFLLSVADSLGPDPCPFPSPGAGPPGHNQSLGQFVDTCGLVKQYLPYCVVALGSKNFQPTDADPQWWADYCGPIMEALDGLVDEYMSPWEWNLWNKPGDWTLQTFKWMGRAAHTQGASFWAHFSCEYTSWQSDQSDRFAFWDDLGPDVDGCNYQATPVTLGWPWSPPPDNRWDVGEMQARLCDTLWAFGAAGNVHKLRAFELTAIDQFVNEHPNEDEANAIGYIAACMFDDVKVTGAVVWGSGNGVRRPDGTPV